MFTKTATGFIVHRPDKHAVWHDTLPHITYPETIEDWVRGSFPGANYVRIDHSSSIESVDATAAGVFAIQAPKGTGKSKAIRASVHMLPPETKALQVTFRRTLACSSKQLMGPSATLYLDVLGPILADEHPRHTVVINSIARVRGTYDVVIIDELVSVLDSLSSCLLSGTARVDATVALAKLIAGARTVIVADAMLDATCLDFVLTCRKLAALTTPPLTVYDYTKRIHGDYTFVAHENPGTWKRELAAQLDAGKRVVVPCMTKSMAVAIAKEYESKVVTEVYSADTDPQKMYDHMSDIHTHWSKVQLLVYSPVVTAGCSFELKHFDVVFFYGVTGLASVRSAIQMIARVRDVGDKVVHVCIDRAAHYGPVQAAPLPIAHTSVCADDVYLTLLRMLAAYRRNEDACSTRCFPHAFWTLVRHSGASIRFVRQALLEHVPKHMLEVTTGTEADAGQQTRRPYVRREHWSAHAWDSVETGLSSYSIQEPISFETLSSYTLVQKVSMLNTDHVGDVELACVDVPRLTVTRTDDSDTVLKFPVWCTVLELEGRMRAWCRLIAQKSVWQLGGGEMNPHYPIPTSRPATRYVNVYGLTCMGLRSFVPATVKDSAVRATRKFMQSTSSVIEVLQDAWVLAGMETAFRYDLPGTPSVLDAMPQSCVELALAISERVSHKFRYASWVGVNVPMPRNSGVLDYLYMDYMGCFHAVTVRVGGDAISCAYMDLLKTQAIVSVLTAPRVLTVTVFYVRTNETVTIDTSAWSPVPLQRALTSEEVPAWNIPAHVCFGCVVPSSPDTYEVYDAATKATVLCTSLADVFDIVNPSRRLVCWNWGAFAKSCDTYDARVCDLALVVCALLRKESCPYRFLNVQRTFCMGTSNSVAGAARVSELYLGIVLTGLVLYFHGASKEPEGISLRTVPCVDFMKQYFDNV